MVFSFSFSYEMVVVYLFLLFILFEVFYLLIYYFYLFWHSISFCALVERWGVSWEKEMLVDRLMEKWEEECIYKSGICFDLGLS